MLLFFSTFFLTYVLPVHLETQTISKFKKKGRKQTCLAKTISTTSPLKIHTNLRVPQVCVRAGNKAICLYRHSLRKSLSNLQLSFGRYASWFMSQEGGSPRNSLCHFSHADTLNVQRFRRLNLSIIVLWFKLFNYFKYWLSNFLLTYFVLKQICCQHCIFIRRAPFEGSVRMVMNIPGFFQSIWRLLQYTGQILFFPIYENCSIQLIADILL